MNQTVSMRHITAATALALAAALSGCVVAPYPGYGRGYAAAPAYEVEIDAPPPPPRVEVVPGIPFAGALWIGGYWGWQGGRHTWIGGRWVAPRPGYVYAPHHWEQRGGRWQLHGGWNRGRG